MQFLFINVRRRVLGLVVGVGVAILAQAYAQAQDFGYRYRALNSNPKQMACVNSEMKQGSNFWVGECGWNRDQDLKGLHLHGANLNGSFMLQADLSGAVLTLCEMEQVVLQGANLENADLSQSNLKFSSFSLARARNVNLSGANLQGVDFYRADLSQANFQSADLRHSKFIAMNALLRGEGSIRGADFSNARFEGADLYTVELRLARSLQGATYDDKTRLPVFFRKGDAEKWGMRHVKSTTTP